MDLLTLSIAKKYTDESILGTDGINKGEKGDPGYTPIRGVDYWTEDDKNSIISEIDPAPPIVCEETGDVIAVNDSSDRLLKGLTLYGKTTQAGTPTPENPVELESAGASGAINTTVCGKNLIAPDAITFENNNTNMFAYRNDGLLLPAGTYTFSMGENPNGLYVYDKGTDDLISYIYGGNSLTFTLSTSTQVYLKGYMSAKFTEGVIGTLQLEVGNTATAYEPYKGQTLTASTPNGLPGIPVESGGNYTDENGQQWICDEIDFAKNVRLQRIGLIESYAKEVITEAYMSSTGELTNGATVLYVLAAPIETPLSAEELATFSALHTNKPTTTVYNDAGADMTVVYVADTKNYIDQKLAAISAALLNA